MAADQDGEQGKVKAKGVRRSRPQRDPDTHVAAALRSIYNEPLAEAVPSDFMDLLAKLD